MPDATPTLRDRIAQAIRDAICPGDGCPDTEEECARQRVQPCVWERGVLTEVLGTPEVFANAVLAALSELPAQQLCGTADDDLERKHRARSAEIRSRDIEIRQLRSYAAQAADQVRAGCTDQAVALLRSMAPHPVTPPPGGPACS